MKSSSFKYLVWVFIISLFLLHICSCKGYTEEERRSLLAFKASLKLNNDDDDFLLSSWIDDNTSDYCDWDGVYCNPITTRIERLEVYDLRQIFYLGNDYVWQRTKNEKQWVLNSSLFLSFEELRVLDLSRNLFHGFIEYGGWCEMKKLRELDLSINYLEGILPPCFNNLTSLKLLDLSRNLLTGSVSSSIIPNLASLEYIDLSHNSFVDSFSFSSFANHSKLQVIMFASDDDKFEVETEYPAGWVPMFQLKVLVLSRCKLTGDVPRFLQSQSKLRKLDLSHNSLTGRFPNWLLEKNGRLQVVQLRNNSFKGRVLQLRHNTSSKIGFLDLSDNQFGGQLDENMLHTILHTRYLNLSNNGFEGNLPSSIADMGSLELLDLSANNFSGEIPKQLVAAQSLRFLKLSNNKFHGEIFSRDFCLSGLGYLHLQNNQFTGTLSNLISRSSQLITLVVGNNNFEGRLPAEISQLQGLKFLDVSHNLLSGPLPCLKELVYLEHLHLQGNMFTGLIPTDFLNSSDLLTLDVRDNNLSGSIPNSISALSNLRILLLRGNLLSGSLPNQLCHLTNISLMDLSNNFLSGSIPSCFVHIRFGNIRRQDIVFGDELPFALGWSWGPYPLHRGYIFKSLVFSSEQTDEEVVEFVTKKRPGSYKGGILNFMSGLDLSCNNFTGEIPPQLGTLSSIHALNLSYNQLKGSIPKSFSNLSQIESLDLSCNKLSGEIPPELTALNFLEVFSVAHNNISGRVPDMKAQFGTFDESSYEDNPFLCGPMLKRKCDTADELPASPASEPSQEENEGKWYDIDLVVFSASFSASYMMVVLGIAAVLYINPYWRRRWFNFIEECMYSCYYFCCDNLSNLVAYF